MVPDESTSSVLQVDFDFHSLVGSEGSEQFERPEHIRRESPHFASIRVISEREAAVVGGAVTRNYGHPAIGLTEHQFHLSINVERGRSGLVHFGVELLEFSASLEEAVIRARALAALRTGAMAWEARLDERSLPLIIAAISSASVFRKFSDPAAIGATFID